MLKKISVPFRTLAISVCIFSLLTVAMLPLVNSSSTSAAESNAIDGTASAIQGAINDLNGAPGTIYVSEGEWTWGVSDKVTLHEGVTLIGTGTSSTVINMTRNSSTYTAGAFYIPGGEDDCRISGMRINIPDGMAGMAIRIGDYGYTTRDYIIDNMEFHGFGAYEGAIKIRAAGRGLICDSTFYGYTDGTWGYGVVYYGSNVYTTDNSAYLGTAENLFIERCTFYRCKHVVSSDMGAHYVFRYNTVKENQYYPPIDAHGGLASNQQGTNSCEVYNNSISDPISESGHAAGMRGGQSYFFNNQVSGYNYAIGYRLEATNDPTYIVHDSYEWNNSDNYDYGTSYVMNLYNSRSYVFEGTHYFANTKPDGYTPYTYPHPLTPESGVTPNNLPVAIDDTATIEEDSNATAIDVLTNDNDADGDVLSVESVTEPVNGTTVKNGDGTITYTPNSNYFGTDSFTYVISDSNGGTDTAKVNVTINPINGAPVADDQSVTTNEDNIVDITLTGSDIDGDPLTFSIVSGPSNGSLSLITANALTTYTPGDRFTGTDSFTFKAYDGKEYSNIATVTIAGNVPPSEPTVSVSKITYATEGGKYNDRHLLVTVYVTDDMGNPVEGVSVSIDVYLNGNFFYSKTGKTETDGSVTHKATKAPPGLYMTKVTNIIAEGLTWDGVTQTTNFPK